VFPGRELQKAQTPEGLRDGWVAVQSAWQETVAGTPPDLVDAHVADDRPDLHRCRRDGLRHVDLPRRPAGLRGDPRGARRTTRWLGDLLTTRGWPGRALADEDGAQAAFLLAQHADHAPALQQAFLDALREAVDQGDASPAHLAYLEDRVRVHAGLPQLYGTSSSTRCHRRHCSRPAVSHAHRGNHSADIQTWT
jgi:uncharacterized protein DUF6624